MTLFTATKNRQADKDGKQPPVSKKKRLSRADRRQIEAAIARANRTDRKEKSAQDSIPYERMWPDGICRVADGHYTKTIQFQDINYQLSQNEDKAAIFEGWCDFLNYFDSSIQFQLSFLNLAASEETFARAINIPLQGDDFDTIRVEYMTMLQNQLAKGNNGLIKTKYLTFGVDADSLKAAKPRLERIETDILNNFKRVGVAAEALDGKARLAQLHGIFHMDEQVPFRFEWEWLAPSGLSTKDFIAPSSFEFRTGKQFRMGKKYGAVSFLQILAPELNDRMLADFLDMESSLIVSLHIQSVDQIKAIKTVKRKITDLDKSKIEEQKKAVRAGYDMDIIPSDLATYGAEAKKLLQDLQSRNERMFLVTFLVLNTADNPRQLDNNVFQASSIAQKYNCQLTRLDFQQEEGLMSCADELPAPGPQSNRDSARADHQFHGYLCSVHHPGAFPERQRGAVLRDQRPVQQSDYGGPQAAQKPQRPDPRHTGLLRWKDPYPAGGWVHPDLCRAGGGRYHGSNGEIL